MSAKFELYVVDDSAMLGAEAFLSWHERKIATGYLVNVWVPENPFPFGTAEFSAWREGWNRAHIAGNGKSHSINA